MLGHGGRDERTNFQAREDDAVKPTPENPSVTVRPVRMGDEIGLQASCFAAMTVEQVRAEVVLEGLERASRTSFVVLVAEREGEIVGSLTLVQPDHILTRHRVGVAGFVVAARARGTGMARRLIDEAADWARRWGGTMLEISCRGGTHAEEAYRGLGFIEWGRLPQGLIEHDGAAFDDVHFYRPLA